MTIGVTASMLLLSLGANAQTTELGLKGNKSSYEMLAPMKLTPAERKAKLAESIRQASAFAQETRAANSEA